jgi:hypothetical protein
MRTKMTAEGNRYARRRVLATPASEFYPQPMGSAWIRMVIRTLPHGPIVLDGLQCGLLRLEIRRRWYAVRIDRGLSSWRINKSFRAA